MKYDGTLENSTAGCHYAELSISETGTYNIKANLTLKTDLKAVGYHVHTCNKAQTERSTILCGPCKTLDAKGCWTPPELNVHLLEGSTLYVGFLFNEYPRRSRRVQLRVQVTKVSVPSRDVDRTKDTSI